MKKLMTVILLAGTLALPLQSDAWVTYAHAGYGGYGHVGYTHVSYGGCYHSGWSCGGVSTGTAVAAGVAGLATGAIIGAAVARPPVVVAPAPVYVAPAPVYVAPAPVVAAPVYIPPTAPIGSVYYALPTGAQSANINGTQYYVLGSTYYRPYFGSNGVYYQVVANPI